MGAMWSLRFLSSLKALGPLCLRAAIGYSFFWVHGRAKVMPLGEFDWGKSFAQGRAAAGVADEWLLHVAAWTEFLAGAALLLGLMTRWASIGLLCVMGYAVFRVHAAHPYGAKELAIAYSAGLLTLLFTGAGPVSADRMLFGKDVAASGE